MNIHRCPHCSGTRYIAHGRQYICTECGSQMHIESVDMTPTALHANHEHDDLIDSLQSQLAQSLRREERLRQALERYRGQLDRDGDMSAGRVLRLMSGEVDYAQVS